MFHKDFPRILVGQCTKCSGALREQIDPGEWMCVNCGLIVLEEPVDLSHIKYNARGNVKHSVEPRPPTTPPDEEPEEVNPVQSLEEEVEEEQEGDDQEWNKLVTFHTNSMIVKEEYNICGECGKKGSYIYRPITKPSSSDVNIEYCKFCNPRRSWKPLLNKESLRNE